MRSKKKWLSLGLVTLGLVLAACGNGDNASTSDSNAAAKSSDTFTYAIGGDPSSINPINTSDRWGLTVSNMIFSPLVAIDGDGKMDNVLAESVEPAADGKSVTVKLKSGIKWSDGQPLTADDVVFTYTEKAKKENGNSDSLWIDDKPITANKVDDLTVRFDFPVVSAAAVNNIITETFIIPQHVYKDVTDFSVSELPEKPVGTGPYQLVDYKRGEYLQFKANDNYFDGKPSIENVTLRITQSTETAKVALQKGEVDATVVLPADIQDLDTKQIKVYPYSENRIGYMGLNSKSEALQDVKVRQAVLYALNKDEMNKAAYLEEKYYETPYSFLPPNNKYATEDVEKYKTNDEKAKDLLKEAGVSDLKLNLGFDSSDPAQTLQATLIQQQLQKVGISVELQGGDSTALFTELKKPDSTKYNLFLGGYIMGNDPDQYARLFKTGGASNYFKLNSEAVDTLFNQGAVELDQTKRDAIYDKLQAEIADQAVIYPIVDNKKILAATNRLGGIEEAKLVPIYTFEDMGKLTLK